MEISGINRTLEITSRKRPNDNAAKPWATLIRDDGKAFGEF